MKELFAIGSIVTIKGITKPVMIMGYLHSANGKMYDYIGVPYPSGLISKQSAIAFNHEFLETLVAEGYKDEDCGNLLKALPRLVSGAAAIKEAQKGE